MSERLREAARGPYAAFLPVAELALLGPGGAQAGVLSGGQLKGLMWEVTLGHIPSGLGPGPERTRPTPSACCSPSYWARVSSRARVGHTRHRQVVRGQFLQPEQGCLPALPVSGSSRPRTRWRRRHRRSFRPASVPGAVPAGQRARRPYPARRLVTWELNTRLAGPGILPLLHFVDEPDAPLLVLDHCVVESKD